MGSNHFVSCQTTLALHFAVTTLNYLLFARRGTATKGSKSGFIQTCGCVGHWRTFHAQFWLSQHQFSQYVCILYHYVMDVDSLMVVE